MRISFAAVFLLAILGRVTVPARASTIYDFVLTGEGHTMTYSVPISRVVRDHPHAVTFNESAATTIDGVPGYNVATEYYLYSACQCPSIIWGGTTVLWGPFMEQVTVIPISNPSEFHPYDLLVTFLPGTYQFYKADHPVYISDAPYTLTITPAADSSVPEPASLGLAATGWAGALEFARRRKR